MLRARQSFFSLYLLSLLLLNTELKEQGNLQDLNESSSDSSQVTWDSVLKSAKLGEFIDSSPNLDDINSPDVLGLEKSDLKVSQSEAKHFIEDEVFVEEGETTRNSVVAKKSARRKANKPKNTENKLFKAFSEAKIAPEVSKGNQITLVDKLKLGNSDKHSESDLPTGLSELSKFDPIVTTSQQVDDSSSRSFIFNPNAAPQEHFQNCTTPKNESGSCRYLQHCLIPTIVGSLNQFMGYVCIIEERFIGVCCPEFPVHVVMVKEEKVPFESETVLNKECGVGTNNRIVGGSKADPKAWPWMVALLSKSRKQFFCGGALINDRYVLTAAHCTFNIRNNEIIARLGEYDFKNEEGKTHEEYAVSEIKRHGHYNRRTLRNDIALLKLEKPVVFNEFIKTICLPEVENSYVGEEATLTGWGNTAGGGRTSEVLMQASFPVISNEDCSKGHGLPILPSLICTSAEEGDKGACNGDSGGPLMLLDKNNRWKVIGLVSWGRRGCSPEYPTVYTRVSQFLDWIKRHSK